MEEKKRNLLQKVSEGMVGMIHKNLSEGSSRDLCCEFPQIGTPYRAELCCDRMGKKQYALKAGVLPKSTDRLRFCFLCQGTAEDCLSWLEMRENQEVLFQTLERLAREQAYSD